MTKKREVKTVALSMTRNYVSNWSVADAVREFIQNKLDTGNYDFSVESDRIVMESWGGQIPHEYLALGGGSKTGNSSQLGGYSEGMKLAMLILARENVPVKIINGNVTWTPYFDYNVDFGCETLYIDIEESEEVVEGVKTIIELDSNTIDEVVERTLHLQNDYDKIETSYGEVLTSNEHKGKVFVGGLFIDNFESDYGFNFQPEDFPLDRDRKTLKPFDLQWRFKDMVAEMTEQLDEEGADRFVNNVVNRDKSLDYVYEYALPSSENVIKSVEKVYKEKYDGKLVTGDYEEAEKWKKAGNNNVALVNNSKLVSMIQKTESYQTVVLGKVESEEKDLEEMIDDFENEFGNEMSSDMDTAWQELKERILKGV